MAACSSLQQLNAGNAHFSLFASIQLLQGGKYSNWFHEMPPPPPIPLFCVGCPPCAPLDPCIAPGFPSHQLLQRMCQDGTQERGQ